MMDKSMPSIQQKNFQALPAPKPSRSKFNLSHSRRFNFNPSELYPVLSRVMIPGDTFRGTTQAFIRLATQAHPTMDNARVIIEAFFVPFRLVWDNFQRFMGERSPNPDSSIDYVMPYLNMLSDETPVSFQFAIGTQGDAFGFPVERNFEPGPNDDYPSSPMAAYFRGYHKIWNDWYRSDVLQDSVTVLTDDGPDSADLYENLLKRCKPHDYFTSALPWPQRGDAVPLPIGGRAPVFGEEDLPLRLAGVSSGQEYSSITTIAENYFKISGGAPGASEGLNVVTEDGTEPSGLYANLDGLSGTINMLREFIVVQQMLEATARSGSRYIDQVKAIFGVTIPDFRLQRAEYVGGNKSTIGIHSVAQTSPTSGSDAQAGLGAYGTGFGQLQWQYSAVEHGLLYVLLSVTTDLTYQNQMPRESVIRTQYDFFRPEMAHLGEQPVLNQEVYFSGAVGTGDNEDQGIWGYQERWAEYRYIPSIVTGDFRSQSSASLEVWHWAQDFESLPGLGATFIEDSPPMERTVAVQNEPLLLAQVQHNITAARPIPVYSIPGLKRL